MKIYFKTKLNHDVDFVRKHCGEKLFNALKPPGVKLNVERFDGCKKGDEVHLSLNVMGLTQKWVSLITYEQFGSDRWVFVDEGTVLPSRLKKWRHRHGVYAVDEKRCEIIDDIEFECGQKNLERLIYPMLWMSFAIRPVIYPKYFKDCV